MNSDEDMIKLYNCLEANKPSMAELAKQEEEIEKKKRECKKSEVTFYKNVEMIKSVDLENKRKRPKSVRKRSAKTIISDCDYIVVVLEQSGNDSFDLMNKNKFEQIISVFGFQQKLFA
jgi:hypothetical protein